MPPQGPATEAAPSPRSPVHRTGSEDSQALSSAQITEGLGRDPKTLEALSLDEHQACGHSPRGLSQLPGAQIEKLASLLPACLRVFLLLLCKPWLYLVGAPSLQRVCPDLTALVGSPEKQPHSDQDLAPKTLVTAPRLPL